MAKRNGSRRSRLAEAQNWRCAYCHGSMNPETNRPDGATLEHVVARRLGGGDGLDNLVAACRACNQARSAFHCAMSFARVRRWRLLGGDWPACSVPTKRVRQRVELALADVEYHQLCAAWIERRRAIRMSERLSVRVESRH